MHSLPVVCAPRGQRGVAGWARVGYLATAFAPPPPEGSMGHFSARNVLSRSPLLSNYDDDESIDAGDNACGSNPGMWSAPCVFMNIWSAALFVCLAPLKMYVDHRSTSYQRHVASICRDTRTLGVHGMLPSKRTCAKDGPLVRKVLA